MKKKLLSRKAVFVRLGLLLLFVVALALIIGLFRQEKLPTELQSQELQKRGISVTLLDKAELEPGMDVYIVRVNGIPCIVFSKVGGVACDCDFTKGNSTPGGDFSQNPR